MEITAVAKSVRVSPRKVRLVAGAIKNMPASKALDQLTLVEKRGSSILIDVIKSAIANAVNNKKLEKDNLLIARLEINQGSSLKRYHASTRGRVHPYKKKSTHIKVVLKEKEGENNK